MHPYGALCMLPLQIWKLDGLEDGSRRVKVSDVV